VRTPRTIYFLSDFGLSDAYVGIVKAVVASIASDARVIDLAHELPPHDLRHGAYQLYEAAPYLPDGSIVLAVVDPGVGSERRAVVVEGARCLWVAPDNGLLAPALTLDPPSRAFRLERDSYQLSSSARTFDGRDVFGPAAAHLIRGVDPRMFGSALDVAELCTLGVAPGPGPGGEVWTFDRFGNAITTLRPPLADSRPGPIRIAGHELPLVDHFAAVEPGAPLALVGSAGLVEVCVREGDARDQLGLTKGTRVTAG
jgi:hypothetical protein